MDHIRIVRRAARIAWSYRALWVFGFLLALTSGGGSGNGGGSGSNTGNFNPGRGNVPWNGEFPQMPNFAELLAPVMGIIIAVLCVLFILAVLFTVLRYVANTALIRMVDGYEATETKVRVGQGFRLGWSRGAFRTWVVGLIFGLGGFLFVILSLLIVAAPLLLWTTGDQTSGWVGVAIAIGLFFLMILVWIVVFAALSILTQLINRAIILEGLGIGAGIRRGWALFRRRLGDNIVVGLILFGLRVIYGLLTIPIAIMLFLAALVIAGVPALLTGGVANLLTQDPSAWVPAVLVALPIFLIVLVLPLVFIEGLWETYNSTTWTLAFRELLSLESVSPVVPPAPAEPGEQLPSTVV